MFRVHWIVFVNIFIVGIINISEEKEYNFQKVHNLKIFKVSLKVSATDALRCIFDHSTIFTAVVSCLNLSITLP
jgi:hypothetical protein